MLRTRVFDQGHSTSTRYGHLRVKRPLLAKRAAEFRRMTLLAGKTSPELATELLTTSLPSPLPCSSRLCRKTQHTAPMSCPLHEVPAAHGPTLSTLRLFHSVDSQLLRHGDRGKAKTSQAQTACPRPDRSDEASQDLEERALESLELCNFWGAPGLREARRDNHRRPG